MPAEVLAIGSSAANSSDVVIGAGTVTLFCLKGTSGIIPPNSFVNVFVKGDAGNYYKIGEMTNQNPAIIVQAPGIYRFSREARGACGVFSA